jgi:hypothetical protein
MAKDGARRTVYETAEAALVLREPMSLPYLKEREASKDEPYLTAVLALIAHRAQDTELAVSMAERLRRMARRENGATYWSMETHTPFYGWGLAGRLETTALAVRALAEIGAAEDRPLIASGALFLLRHKDHYGVWWSTHATVKVLQSVLMLSLEGDGSSGPAEIVVNGKPAATLRIPGSREVTGPGFADVSALLVPGDNHVTVRRPGGGKTMQVQLAESHFMPWPASNVTPSKGPLNLAVTFDRMTAKPGDTIACHVDIQRVGFRGYGMMVAEIGLPPGVDVDRQSLDDAVKASGWAVNHYDVLPDRVVFYVWPHADGTRLTFRFRPRFGMQAKNAASVLYDYYNPEASVVVAPVQFRVEALK